jgi:glycosyltransferase involved in cell wall biosynthesis
VSDRVEIVPGVPKAEVPDRLSRADVFVNTTSVDNVPVSLLEALACGLCVVDDGRRRNPRPGPRTARPL